MTKSMSGAVLLLILAAGGFIQGDGLGYVAAAVAAMLAFLTEELRDAHPDAVVAVALVAICSWAAVATSFLALVI